MCCVRYVTCILKIKLVIWLSSPFEINLLKLFSVLLIPGHFSTSHVHSMSFAFQPLQANLDESPIWNLLLNFNSNFLLKNICKFTQQLNTTTSKKETKSKIWFSL